MRPGQLLVVRLGKGASIVRYLERSESRVSVALGRNRLARILPDRVLLETSLVVADEEEAEGFKRQCQALFSYIDLSEVWEVVNEEAGPLGLDGLAELCWGPAPSMAQKAALALHLDRGSDYFEYTREGYIARSREAVEEIQLRRMREAENAEATERLINELSRGNLPSPLTHHQESLVQHLRGYAVHGDDYGRARAARNLLERTAHRTRDLQRRSFDLLVAGGVFSPDEPLELHRAGVDEQFPEDALAEATALVQKAGHPAEPRRKDLTSLDVVTIDDEDAEDRDDALSLEVEVEGTDTVASGYRIAVHIADAGELIPQGGSIDREADRRMATVYLPERTIGMLPPCFSRRVGSLDPGEVRLSMSLLARVEASGEVTEWEVTPSVIRSRAALSYDDVDQALVDAGSQWHEMLSGLNRAAQSWRRRREAAGAVNVDQPEMAVRVHPSGQVEVKVLERASPARQLVSEMMILCNCLLAEFCSKEGLPAVYRSQASPDLDTLGVDPRAGLQGAPQRYLLMKRLAPAELTINPAPHGGLGVPSYIQASSPLRRYPDLVMQRQISHFLGTGETLYQTDTVESVVQRAEVQLREVARLEEERKRYWFLKYLEKTRLHDTGPGGDSDLFAATVLENDPRRRALLELIEFPFRLRAELSPACVPGDTVTLRLQGVDLWRRIGHFVQARDAD